MTWQQHKPKARPHKQELGFRDNFQKTTLNQPKGVTTDEARMGQACNQKSLLQNMNWVCASIVLRDSKFIDTM